MKRLWIIVLLVGALGLIGCGGSGVQESPLPTPDTGIANPASVYCEEQGYVLEMREEAAGTVGYCLFPDGTECEEWAFYRGECAPGTPKP